MKDFLTNNKKCKNDKDNNLKDSSNPINQNFEKDKKSEKSLNIKIFEEKPFLKNTEEISSQNIFKDQNKQSSPTPNLINDNKIDMDKIKAKTYNIKKAKKENKVDNIRLR